MYAFILIPAPFVLGEGRGGGEVEWGSIDATIHVGVECGWTNANFSKVKRDCD